jgi:hypothetical protein
VHEAQSGQFQNQRRRSERVSQPLPIVVRGTDLLGQPFEERTMALAYNFHGCRYSSKHHLSHNAWVTIEVQRYDQPHIVQARVAWTQRPQSVRDFFQVGVELESPANVWGLEFPPDDWRAETLSGSETYQQYLEQPSGESSQATGSPFIGTSEELVAEIPFDSPLNAVFASPSERASDFNDFSQPQDALLHNLDQELRRQAQEAVQAAAARVTDTIRASVEEVHQQKLATAEEFFRTWKEEFARSRGGESDAPFELLTESQANLLNTLKAQFEERFGEARQLLDQLDQKAQSIRSEAEQLAKKRPPNRPPNRPLISRKRPRKS